MHARLLGLLLVTPAVAQADVAPAEPTAAPSFALLDRQDSVSKVGVDGSYYVVDQGDATIMRFDLHGHFVDPGSRVGGYAQIPIAYADEDGGDSVTAVGNLEVGLLFAPRMQSREFGLVGHAGLTLPTGDTINQDGFVGAVIGLMRPADLYQALPRSSTIRFGGSGIYRSGNAFGRVDVGLDLNVYLKDADDEADPAFHLGIGGGYDSGVFAIAGELSVLSTSGDNGESIIVGAISARGTGGTVHPYGALVIPLDNDVGDIFDLGILLGIEANL